MYARFCKWMNSEYYSEKSASLVEINRFFICCTLLHGVFVVLELIKPNIIKL